MNKAVNGLIAEMTGDQLKKLMEIAQASGRLTDLYNSLKERGYAPDIAPSYPAS
jgi:uncharacterized protein (UPF0297 family)